MPGAEELPGQQALSLPALPNWARVGGPGKEGGPVRESEEVAFETGAAFAALHIRVMAEAPFAGVWRRRLALKAAAASARMVRRGEHEEMLRDAFYLRTGSEDAGPAGRLLVAWRALDRSSPLDDEGVFHLAEILQLKKDDALRSAIKGAQQLATSDRGAPAAAAETVKLVTAVRPDGEILALWLADAVLAARLGWPQPVPLLANALLDPGLHNSSLCIGGKWPHPAAANWSHGCMFAYGRAAAKACDLFGNLQRQSQKLLAIAPQLGTKQADAVIELFLSEDAVLPSSLSGAMSRFAALRMIDRLVELGAVRELTGRATFRLYGL
jgi:Protein of unknown function (DUF1403)